MDLQWLTDYVAHSIMNVVFELLWPVFHFLNISHWQLNQFWISSTFHFIIQWQFLTITSIYQAVSGSSSTAILIWCMYNIFLTDSNSNKVKPTSPGPLVCSRPLLLLVMLCWSPQLILTWVPITLPLTGIFYHSVTGIAQMCFWWSNLSAELDKQQLNPTEY